MENNPISQEDKCENSKIIAEGFIKSISPTLEVIKVFGKVHDFNGTSEEKWYLKFRDTSNNIEWTMDEIRENQSSEEFEQSVRRVYEKESQ